MTMKTPPKASTPARRNQEQASRPEDAPVVEDAVDEVRIPALGKLSRIEALRKQHDRNGDGHEGTDTSDHPACAVRFLHEKAK